jgi:intracellular septation protein
MGKLFLDLFPLLLFFVAYKVYDIYVATAVAIVASIGVIIWLKLRGRPIETMQWLGLGIIVVFGGLTLLLQDETFIKLKPTVLYLAFAAVLLFGRLLSGKNLIKAVMGKQIQLPEPVWSTMNWLWIVFFTLMGALNVLIAYTMPTETWVQFKVFGATALTIVFVIGLAVWMGRHVIEDPSENTPEQEADQ